MGKRLFFALLLTIGACQAKQRTMLVVQVDSNMDVPTQLNKVDVAITVNGITKHWPYSLISDYKLPLHVGVVEASDGAGDITIVASGYLDPNSTAIVSETAIVGFVEGDSMELKLYLASECIAKACDQNKTCTMGGNCRETTRQPSELTPFVSATAAAAGGSSGSGGNVGAGGNFGTGGSGSSGPLPIDATAFGQKYKLADNEISGWTQGSASDSFWAGTDLFGGIDGAGSAYMDRGFRQGMIQNLNGPDSQSCVLRAMDFGTGDKATAMYAYAQANFITNSIAIPTYDSSTAIGDAEISGLTAFAHFGESYFEVRLIGLGDQRTTCTECSAAQTFLDHLKKKAN